MGIRRDSIDKLALLDSHDKECEWSSLSALVAVDECEPYTAENACPHLYRIQLSSIVSFNKREDRAVRAAILSDSCDNKMSEGVIETCETNS